MIQDIPLNFIHSLLHSLLFPPFLSIQTLLKQTSSKFVSILALQMSKSWSRVPWEAQNVMAEAGATCRNLVMENSSYSMKDLKFIPCRTMNSKTSCVCYSKQARKNCWNEIPVRRFKILTWHMSWSAYSQEARKSCCCWIKGYSTLWASMFITRKPDKFKEKSRMGFSLLEIYQLSSH